MREVSNNKGFTLIELLSVLAILSIIMSMVVALVFASIENAKIAADQATSHTLNTTTTLYSINLQKSGEDIFAGFDTDEQRMAELTDKGFLIEDIQPQRSGNAFVWLIEEQLWVVFDGEIMVPLSPLGSSFDEISRAMIDLINDFHTTNGVYARTWGDYRYTDLGLDPEDWENPIAHIYFKPVGSSLNVRPAEGYEFIVVDLTDNIRVLTHSSNWNFVYSALDETWYFKSISSGDVIDISTLEIRRS